ncbi:REP-associated tyrosine transposase [Tabrizicola sp.]|uniref:REP-associated tyrosine transposase n=1 Tax=Tabrizicola sp. TaxID=2005166 RepID=UPI003F34662B
MSRYLRPRVVGASVFFTVALADRRARTLVEQVDALREAVRVTKAERPFRIDAWVVLPEHMHAVWTLPEGDADYSVRWKEIKTRFTKSVGRVGPRSASKIARGEAGVWQRRFWDHHIRDERDFAAHLRYCWWNPVKHGFVERPVEWPYSSIHREIRLGQVEPEWAGITFDGAFGE